MAEFILPLAKSILAKLAPIGGDIATSYVTDEIKAAMSAKDDLEIIKDKFEAICAVLEDAEEQQYANKAMQLWLKDLKSVAYDIDDLLDELAYDALLRSVNKGHFWRQTRYYLSGSNPILSRFDLGRKIKSLREQLVHIVSKKNDFNLTDRPVEIPKVQRNALDSCDYVNKSAVVGRNEAKEDVIKRLVSLDDDDGALSVLPIIGMGGIGKTALAKLVYHDVTGFDIRLWACVSDEFEIQKILSKILENHSDDNTSNISLGRLTLKLKELLQGKKYFLVLDDVWVDNVTKWIDLKNVLDIGNPGSVILITTRKTEVANITGTIDPYNLDRLPDSISWSIFEQVAFIKDDDKKFPKLFEIGKFIVQKCHGVPLVVKTLGSLLRSERSEVKWLEIKNMDNFTELHGEYDHVMQLLKLSYVKLPSHLKPFFAYLAFDLKDCEYSVAHLANRMRALGLGDSEMQRFWQNYYVELLSKSMIQEPKMSFTGNIINFKVHDMLHDVVVGELGEELGIVTKNELKVSESARYVCWEQSKGASALSDTKCHEKLFRARKTRTFIVGSDGNHVTQSFLEKIIFNFNCLRILEIQHSFIDELPSSIGNLKHLRFLNLIGNPIKSLPDTICELLNLQALYLHQCKQLEELPKRVHRWVNMRHLSVTTRQKSFADTQINVLQNLQDLYIVSCTRLTNLWESNSVGRLASLILLSLENCPRLTILPSSLKLLVTLETLTIKNCQELDLEDGDALSGLLNLHTLNIRQMSHVTRLPDGIQSASKSLEYLWIQKCAGLLELPNWLQSFASLQEVNIEDCQYLSKRCAIPAGEDYPHIRHVPNIWLDGRHFTKSQQ